MGEVTAQMADRRLASRRARYETEVDALMMQALEAAAESETCDVTIGQVLRRTGLSTNTFYKYFNSKEELWLAILRYGRALLDARSRKLIAAQDTLDDQLRAWIGCLIDQARNPSAARLTRPYALVRSRLQFQFPAELHQSDCEVLQPLVSILEAGRASGQYPAVTPERDATLVFMLVQEYVTKCLLTRTVPSVESIDHLHEAVLGLVKRGASRQ